MSRKWTHDKPDANASEIIAFLRIHGIEVVRTDRPVDILIRRDDGVCGFAEIKTLARNATIYRSQIEFFVNSDIPSCIVKTPGEALIFAETMQGFSDSEKRKMDGWLVRNPTVKSLHPAAFEAVLKG